MHRQSAVDGSSPCLLTCVCDIRHLAGNLARHLAALLTGSTAAGARRGSRRRSKRRRPRGAWAGVSVPAAPHHRPLRAVLWPHAPPLHEPTPGHALASPVPETNVPGRPPVHHPHHQLAWRSPWHWLCSTTRGAEHRRYAHPLQDATDMPGLSLPLRPSCMPRQSMAVLRTCCDACWLQVCKESQQVCA